MRKLVTWGNWQSGKAAKRLSGMKRDIIDTIKLWGTPAKFVSCSWQASMLANLLFKCIFVSSNNFINLLAILNKENSWNTADIPPCSHISGLVNVNFQETNFLVLPSQVCIKRRKEMTGPTPWCSEVQKHQTGCPWSSIQHSLQFTSRMNPNNLPCR